MHLLKWNYIHIVLNTIMVTFVMGDRTIITGPDNTTISLGDSVIFTCIVSEELDVVTVVAWKQNGRVITDNYSVTSKVDNERYSVTSGSAGQEYNLHITSVNTLDAGVYTCNIQSLVNRLDTVASSSSAWLSYKSAPRLNYPECTPSADMTYTVGEQVSFSCRSELAVPPVELAWVGETGEVLDADESTQGTFRVSEFTKILTKEDNGKTFECELSHELVTNDRSCVIEQLNVQYPPTDVILRSDEEGKGIDIGSTVSIGCKADANPPIDASTISWSFSSDIPESNFLVNDQFLIITDVTASFNDIIVYCVVNNTLGEERGSFILRVNKPSTTASTKKHPTTTIQPSYTSSSSTTNVITTPRAMTESTTPRANTDSTPPALPETRYTTNDPNLTLDQILGIERNFLIALMIGAFFILLCFVLLLMLVFGRKRTNTILVVNSEDNLRNLTASSSNGSKVILHTPVMDRRNRTASDNPSDDQSFDSAIHLITPVTPGEQPDYRTQIINRSRSNISAVSSQASGTGYMRVPSTELLISSQSQQRLEQPRYVVLDLLNQNGVPFPSADQRQVNYTSATTGRAQVRQVDNKGTGFETIPLRSVSQDQVQELYMFQGGQYIPVQHVMHDAVPPSNNSIKIMIGDSDSNSEEELNPKYRPV